MRRTCITFACIVRANVGTPGDTVRYFPEFVPRFDVTGSGESEKDMKRKKKSGERTSVFACVVRTTGGYEGARVQV